MKRMDQDQPLSSETLTRELGKTLAEEYDGAGILKSAYVKKSRSSSLRLPIPRWGWILEPGP